MMMCFIKGLRGKLIVIYSILSKMMSFLIKRSCNLNFWPWNWNPACSLVVYNIFVILQRSILAESWNVTLEHRLIFFPDDKGKLLVIPGNILLKDLVLENQKLLRELRTWKGKSTDINKINDQTSSHIRSVISQDMKPTPWPVQPSDVSDGSQIDLPNELEQLLVVFLLETMKWKINVKE